MEVKTMKNYMTNYEDPFFSPALFRFLNDQTENCQTAFPMKADILQDKENFYVSVEMPGVKKENINISLKDGYMTIDALREAKKENEGTYYTRKERFYGHASRSFYVGDAGEEDISAKYEDGVLNVTIPVKAIKKEAAARKIAIN